MRTVYHVEKEVYNVGGPGWQIIKSTLIYDEAMQFLKTCWLNDPAGFYRID